MLRNVLRLLGEKTAAAMSLSDISDSTASNRDESFITPRVMDAPPRAIEDNEIATKAHASDKQEPVKETLKGAVKATLPSTSPSGQPPHGNLRDEEVANQVADEVTDPIVEAKDPAVTLNAELAEKSGCPIAAMQAKLERITAAAPAVDAVVELLDALEGVEKKAHFEKLASAWGTVAATGLGVGALGIGLAEGLASPAQASATRQWAGEADRDATEDKARDWGSDLPDFESRLHRYALYGSRSTQCRVFGLGVPGMMNMAHDFAASLHRPDLVDHYANFKKGPVTGYIQMLRERDRWADAAGMPDYQFHVQRGNDFYKDKNLIYHGQRKRGLDFNTDLRRGVIKRIAQDAIRHPLMSTILPQIGLGGLDASQLAEQLEKQNIVETPKVVGREGDSPRPMANEIMQHANDYSRKLYSKTLEELSPKEQEALFEGLNDYVMQADPKLWLRKRYIDNEIGYWTPSAVSMYADKLIHPLNTVRNLSLIGGAAAGAIGLGAGAKWGYDKLFKGAEIDVLTGAPGAGKTTAAKANAAAYDVILHGDLPLKLTSLQRREAVVKRIRSAMRAHNMGQRVLLDSAPRQLKRDYQPLLNAAKRVVILDVPDEQAEQGFAQRTKASPEKSRAVVGSARASLSDLRNDPRAQITDRDTVAAMLRKVAADAEKPYRRRAEVLIVDGLNVYCVEKPYSAGGIWFPGGGVDTSAEKFADAAAREAKEETGIVVDEIHRMANVPVVECTWKACAHDDNPKWAEKAKKWAGDRTFFYVATVHHHGKPTGDDHLGGTWLPLKYVASRLLASIPFDNKGWKALTKARYRAVIDAMPATRAAPRAA